MKKISEFLVKKRYIILAVMLVIAAASIFMAGKTNIITDMTEFLPDDSSMKNGLTIMEDEFGELSSSNNIRLMSTDLSEADKQSLLAELSTLPNVESVDYDAESEDYNKDHHSLFVVNSDYDFSSDEMEQLEQTISKDICPKYNLVYDTNDTASGNLPFYIILMALAILLIVLFIMCESWFEPLIFLATISVAIVINNGTNALLGGVSQITNSIGAILQLVLSMDYSIILINRYRQELVKNKGKYTAMSDAISSAASSIMSSSLTTVVGLLALVFMSFKIGADMGIVLAKGVFISMISIFTVLPALILLCDKLIRKTAKKVPAFKMNKLADFCVKIKPVFPCLLIVIFAATFVLKGNTPIAYTMEAPSDVSGIFPKTNSIVVLYKTEDENNMAEIAAEIEKDNSVKSVSSYSTTLAKQYSVDELSDVIADMSDNIDIQTWMLNFIYFDASGNETPDMFLKDFIDFISDFTDKNPDLLSEFDSETLAQLDTIKVFADKDELAKTRTPAEIAALFGMDEEDITPIFTARGMEKVSVIDFIQIIGSMQSQSGMGTSADASSFALINTIITNTESDKTYTPAEIAALFGGMSDMLDENTVSLIYKLYYSETTPSTDTMSMEQLLEHLMSMTADEKYANLFDDEMKTSVKDAEQSLTEGKNQLVGKEYSIMMISSALAEESDETNAFLQTLETRLNTELDGDYYLIGNSPMQYEMSQTFGSEFNKISIITALAIFFVILITFRSLSIPVILILVIQSAIYATMVIIGFTGSGMYYLALLIVQSILMGATVDYGILFTNYYRENRKTHEPKEALRAAYHGSIHTILTSGLIMVLVTWILGYAFADPAIGQICHIIALGATTAIVLIVFILPGVLVALDGIISGVKKQNSNLRRKH